MDNSTIKDSVSITLKGQQFDVKFPNIGQYIKIEAAKQKYADGNYALLAWSNIKSMNTALDLVDAISYFSVLIGAEFLKTYNIQTTDAILEKINHASDEGKELMDAYKTYSEFYNSIEKRNDRPALEEEEEEKEDEVADVNS